MVNREAGGCLIFKISLSIVCQKNILAVITQYKVYISILIKVAFQYCIGF